MALRLFLLAASAGAADLPKVFAVAPRRVAKEVATTLTVYGEGFTPNATVAIDGLSGNLYSADLVDYRPMQALSATYVRPRG